MILVIVLPMHILFLAISHFILISYTFLFIYFFFISIISYEIEMTNIEADGFT